MNVRLAFLVAGVFCIGLAVLVQGVMPMLEPQSRYTKVTRVVRTELGDLKWTEHTARPYDDPQQRGRAVYIREGCWYCHSQYVRPVTGETRRWGPITQSGEYAYDLPHLFSTRRIGPDLSRVGLKYSDEWHLAHFWDPRMVVPDSIMPRFVGLFDGPHGPVAIVDDDRGHRTLARTEVTERWFDYGSDRPYKLTPNAEGLLFVPGEAKGRYPVIWTPNDEFTGEEVRVVAATQELAHLIAYLQKLGINRGKWRDKFEPQQVSISEVSVPRSAGWIDYGRQVYRRRCIGCHGENGDGNGPAATFMYKFRPRNFTWGLFKFRRTPTGSLPTDGDLLRTITRGVRGTAMPTWHMLPEKDRLAVVQYIKYELAVDRADPDYPYAYFEEEQPLPPIHIGRPPGPTAELIARGQEVWVQAKCAECHGEDGKGGGKREGELETDFGFPIQPADLTTGQFKSGSLPQDLYRTISTGLMGTPMPSYSDSIEEAERWALVYYVLSLSAYTDPLTGEPLQIAEADREALNDPATRAPTSERAYARDVGEPGGLRFGGAAWAEKHGIELLGKEAGAASARASPEPRGDGHG